MLSYEPKLDSLFAALADPTRRAVLERLSEGPATVTELAKPFAMSLPSLLQHLQVLESSGLVRSEKKGRVRTCRIDPAALDCLERWVAERRASWAAQLDQLGAYLDSQQSPEEPP